MATFNLREATAYRFVWFVNGAIVTTCDGRPGFDYDEEIVAENIAEFGEESISSDCVLVEVAAVPTPYTALVRTRLDYGDGFRYFLVR